MLEGPNTNTSGFVLMALDGNGDFAPFRNAIGRDIFVQKYAHEGGCETWEGLAFVLVEDVCRDLISPEDKAALVEAIRTFKFLPGGRYLRNAGRPLKFFSNCFALRAEEDTREDWAQLSWKAESCLISGGGIGIDYSIYRHRNAPLLRTGGTASGPVPAMEKVNEIGRRVMQGGSRRSAIYASLDREHLDALEFLRAKDWHNQRIPGAFTSDGKPFTVADAKAADVNFPAPLDHTNVSVNYGDTWLALDDARASDPVFRENVRQAISTSEPGFSFNFGAQRRHTLRNACVPGDTRILTRGGYLPIALLVGRAVDIWNGTNWATVRPFSTGINPLVEVRFSDGTRLRCTPYHKFATVGVSGYGAETRLVPADQLQIGERLAKFGMPIVEGGIDIPGAPAAYSQGFYSADGTAGLEFSNLFEPKFPCIPRLIGTFTEIHGVTAESPNGVKRKIWRHGVMFPKRFVPINCSLAYRREWLAGLFDGDGCVTRDKNGNGLQIASVDVPFLEDLRLLLTTLGVRAKIVHAQDAGWRTMPDGQGGTKEYLCREQKRLLIGNEDTHRLLAQGVRFSRLDARLDAVPQRDARRFVTVEAVEPLDGEVETFCFTEPETGLGTFEGIVTGQCTEFITDDDSDVCNLGSVNLARISSVEEFAEICRLGAAFLYCGTITGLVPNEKARSTRDRNRRIGLGLMGVHEWLVQHGARYGMTDELRAWLGRYRDESERGANEVADRQGLPRPKAYRAIAPTGTIGMIAGTTTGIEPVFSVAYMRRYLSPGKGWVYQFVVESAAKDLIERYGVDPDSIESALSLAEDVERRIRFQADVQDFVDMGISSTINLPAWGSDLNNEDRVDDIARVIAQYAPRLRGLTFYADGSRGGQPLTRIRYEDAMGREGVEMVENDSCKGGVCGA